MWIKRTDLFGNLTIAVTLLIFGAGCQRSPTLNRESKGRVPSNPLSTQNQSSEPAASQPVKPPVKGPVAGKKKPVPKKVTPAPARPAAAPSTAQTARVPVAARQLKSVTFAAGTLLKIRTTTAISTESHKAGDTFVASLDEPLVKEGWDVAPRGSTVQGRVVEADKGGRVQGKAYLDIALDRLETGFGKFVQLSTNTVIVQAKSTKTKDAGKIGIGAGLGAIVGAIAGGKKGAAIGAATGAGAGTAVVLSTRGDAAEIGGETLLSFELRSPLTISESE